MKTSEMKPGGTETTIDVSTLPPKPVKKGTRRMFTDQEKANYLWQVNAAIAAGSMIKTACQDVGIHESQWRQWKADRRLRNVPPRREEEFPGDRVNGQSKGAVSEIYVGITLTIAGQPHNISIEDAIAIHRSLGRLLQHE